MDKDLLPDYMDPVLSLRDPYSKATCLLLYLYSMELGAPQLYADANRASRDMDLTYLKELGPFNRALVEVSYASEQYKVADDKITPGILYEQDYGGVEYNIGGAFLLFRGAAMKDEWVIPYVKKVGKQ